MSIAEVNGHRSGPSIAAEKLAGTAIPLASRVIGVTDAFDAMTQDRALRPDSADAISELLRCAPTQFDPNVVVAFLTVLGKQ